MSDLEPRPDSRLGETAMAIGRGAVGSIPIIGPMAAELIGLTLAPVVYRRQNKWLNDLAEEVDRLGKQSEHWAIENLADNESFASALWLPWKQLDGPARLRSLKP